MSEVGTEARYEMYYICKCSQNSVLTMCCSHGPVFLQTEVLFPQRCYKVAEMRMVCRRHSPRMSETLCQPDTDTPETHTLQNHISIKESCKHYSDVTIINLSEQ